MFVIFNLDETKSNNPCRDKLPNFRLTAERATQLRHRHGVVRSLMFVVKDLILIKLCL